MKIGMKLKWALMIVVCIGLLVLWFASTKRFGQGTIQSINIEIESGGKPAMITDKEILKHLEKEEVTIGGVEIAQTDLNRIERTLAKFPFVKDSKVYLDHDQMLFIEIIQRIPIVRVMPERGKPYYIDDAGSQFPLSDLYTADVPVATGDIDDELSTKLYTLARHVYESVFWKRSIEQIFVSGRGEVSFITKLGSQQVIFGDADRIAAKFDKLEKFYRRALGKVGWDTYRIINVKYKDQVVCK